MRARKIQTWWDNSYAEEKASRCLAYSASGDVCGAAATQVDWQRGCMVCDAHAPPKKLPGPVGNPGNPEMPATPVASNAKLS